MYILGNKKLAVVLRALVETARTAVCILGNKELAVVLRALVEAAVCNLVSSLSIQSLSK
jgi:hypothetical protein